MSGFSQFYKNLKSKQGEPTRNLLENFFKEYVRSPNTIIQFKSREEQGQLI